MESEQAQQEQSPESEPVQVDAEEEKPETPKNQTVESSKPSKHTTPAKQETPEKQISEPSVKAEPVKAEP